MRSFFFLVLSLFLVQCTQETDNEHIQILDEIPQHIQEVENLTVFPGDSEPRFSIELIPELTFGETGESDITEIMGSVVDDMGRVIIRNFFASDEFPGRLYVFNADGTFLTQIGGPGSGPGEFGMITSVQVKAGKVFVLDHTNQRLNVYSSDDYSFERSTLIDQWGIHDHESTQGMDFFGIVSRNDGNHLAIFTERVSDSGRTIFKNLLIDTDGNALDFEPIEFMSTLNVIKRGTSIPNSSMWLPYMGYTIVAQSGDDGLYVAWTQDFLIRKYDANGVYESSFYYPVTGSPFDLSVYTEPTSIYNRADVMNTLEISGEELPESNPILTEIKVDDENRIWAAVPMNPHQEMVEWWILDSSGELLAKLIRPRDQRILNIKNGFIYSNQKDESTGEQTLVKYRIEFSEL